MSNTIQEVEDFDADLFDSMVYGSYEGSEEEDEGVDEVDDTDVDDEHQEDTDQDEESDLDEETGEEDDGLSDEGSEETEDDEEEDALVEDYDSDDEDSEDTDEPAEADSEDGTDTDGTSDGEAQGTDEIDYKAFYDAVVNTEFVVNGKKTKGFADPKKIIQSQQMAGGFSEKMASFKQYRPFMATLKDRGMLEDQAKFDLAMNLIDGDKEAIKAHLKSLSIDPLDLDMDTINYSRKSTLADPATFVIEDTLERARASGIEDRVRQVVGKEWDAESFREFTANEAVRNDLLNHIETGAYDLVQDKMLEMSRLDYDGRFGSMSTINKYRAAVQELQREQASRPAPVARQAASVAPKATQQTSVQAEKAKIEQARKERAYKEKAAKEAAKLNQQRNRAASMSKKSAKPKPKPQFDPMKVEGQELDALMDFLASGGRA